MAGVCGGSHSHELSGTCSAGIRAVSWSREKRLLGEDLGKVQKMPVVGFQLLWR